VYANRGYSKAELGDARGAVDDLDVALTGNPTSEALRHTYTLRINLLNEALHDPGRALKAVDRLLEVDPEFADGYASRASFKLQIGETEGVEADLARAEELGPSQADVWIFLGQYWGTHGALPRGLKALDAAIRIEPEYARAYANRAGIRTRLGDRAGALADLERTFELDQDNATAFANRGALRMRDGDATGARADFERVLTLLPEGHSLRAEIEAELRRMSR